MSRGDYNPGSGSYGFVTKKCPECYTHLPLNVDKLGFATRPFDWSGYLIAIVAIVGFCWFVWWGFFRD
jgi:hypothetical protein